MLALMTMMTYNLMVLTISGRVQKVMILVVVTKRAKRGDFMGFEGLKKKGLKSCVVQVL